MAVIVIIQLMVPWEVAPIPDSQIQGLLGGNSTWFQKVFVICQVKHVNYISNNVLPLNAQLGNTVVTVSTSELALVAKHFGNTISACHIVNHLGLQLLFTWKL